MLKKLFNELVNDLNSCIDKAKGISNPDFNKQLEKTYQFSAISKEEFNNGKITSGYVAKFKLEIKKLNQLLSNQEE